MQTQTIRFPYYIDSSAVDIPIKNLIGVFAPNNVAVEQPPADIIRLGFEKPIQSPRLAELAQSSKHLLILVDDNACTTPVKEYCRPS